MRKIKGLTATSIIQRGLFQGKNDIQICLMVREVYPKYDDKKLRHLIASERSKWKKT